MVLVRETRKHPVDRRQKNFLHIADITEPVGLLFNNPLRPDCRTPHWSYLTQIEAVVGLGPTIRLGFNPGELLDFFFGWTTLDLFQDDLNRRGANQASEATSEPAPGAGSSSPQR